MRSMRASNCTPPKTIGRFSSVETTENGGRCFSTSSHSRARRTRRVRSRSAKRPSICSSFTAAVAASSIRAERSFCRAEESLSALHRFRISSCTSLALRRVEAFGGLLELLGVQAVAREGAERARGLVGEDARAAADLFLPDGGRYAILKSLGFPGSEDHVAQLRGGRNLDCLLGEAGDERARQDVTVLLLDGMREHHLARGLLPAVGDAPVECERGLGARLGNAGLALLRERQEGVGRALQRPGFVGQAGDPEVVELDACGLEQAQYLDRCIGALGLEEGVRADLSQRLKRLRKGHLLRDSIEARQLAERFVPFGLRLELVRVESALARKAGGLEHAGEMPRPLGRRLLREQPGLAQRIEFLQPRAQQRRLAGGGDQLRQDDARAELLTQPRLEAHARAELGLGTADKRRAHQSARFFERDFLL